ncbi:MAG TPA: hypothetical protein VFA88_09215 [Gaiellaceae bacterium]|nr:hypothetical protein [Gaiellaceae bacterium]
MSYLAGDGGEIGGAELALLARLVGMPLPEEDVAALGSALLAQLGAIEQLDQLDLEHVQPALRFDPRWDE